MKPFSVGDWIPRALGGATWPDINGPRSPPASSGSAPSPAGFSESSLGEFAKHHEGYNIYNMIYTPWKLTWISKIAQNMQNMKGDAFEKQSFFGIYARFRGGNQYNRHNDIPSVKFKIAAPENRPSQKDIWSSNPSILRCELLVSGRVIEMWL